MCVCTRVIVSGRLLSAVVPLLLRLPLSLLASQAPRPVSQSTLGERVAARIINEATRHSKFELFKRNPFSRFLCRIMQITLNRPSNASISESPSAGGEDAAYEQGRRILCIDNEDEA
jgi:hypothetical protein